MRIEGKDYRTIWFEDNVVKIIDQTKLPHQFIIKDLKTIKDAINAIKIMEVRGAPLIGATAAYGLVLAIIENNDQSFLKKSADELISSRPTAINLRWAVDRMMNKLSGLNSDKILEIALNEAKDICEEDIKFCENIGLNGLKIIEEIYNKKKDTVNILTHCNAGWLATINWGTATSPIYHAHKKGIPVHVWADETRPRNQGANLTSYELNEEGIKNTIIADNTGGILMQRGEVDMCIVGTDRTLANGDVCNKVGTYLKALAAHDNKIPFYVALPSSTIDWNIKDHKDIPIDDTKIWAQRLSYVGELGYELYVEVKDAKKIYELIIEKGKDHNLSNCGMHAMDIMRMESGFLHWGHDISPEENQYQAGLSFTISNKKNVDFIGKSALEKIDKEKIKTRFAKFTLKDSKPGEPLLLHDEPIYLEDKIIGRSTSGNYSFNFKKNLTFGYINNDFSNEELQNKNLFIEVEKKKYPIEISNKPLKQTNFKNN